MDRHPQQLKRERQDKKDVQGIKKIFLGFVLL